MNVARGMLHFVHMADCKIGDETRERIRSVWPDVLEGMANGDLVRDVLARNLITYGQVRAYLQTEPKAREEWNDAREASADAYHDEAMGIARDRGQVALDKDGRPFLDKFGEPLIIAPDAALARNAIDTLKWAARIRNPRLYSEKAQLDVNIKTVDLTRIISDAQARLEASRQVGNAALLAPIMGLATRVLDDTQEPSA